MIRRLPRVSRDKRETKDNLIHCFRAKVAITFQTQKVTNKILSFLKR